MVITISFGTLPPRQTQLVGSSGLSELSLHCDTIQCVSAQRPSSVQIIKNMFTCFIVSSFMQYVFGRFEEMIIFLDLQNNGKMIVMIIVGAIGPLAHPKTICYHCYEQFLILQKHNDPVGAFHAAISNIVHHTILFLRKKCIYLFGSPPFAPMGNTLTMTFL